MGQEKAFAHITVTAADDDEVIEAGIRPNSMPATDAACSEEDARILRPAQSEAASARGDGISATQTTRALSERPSKDAREDYQAALDELKPQPKPLAQRITLVFAVILIIVALAYYFIFMR